MTGEYFYSIAALFSFSAYLLKDILWLRILLVCASSLYILSGIRLDITSMIGWNSAYLAINLYHISLLILDKNAISLPEETKEIYHQYFSSMTTREFKKIIMINPFHSVNHEQMIADGEITDRLFIVLAGQVNIISSGKVIARLSSGDLIGEMSFMSKEPASASAIAQENVQYAYWTHQDMEKLRQTNCHVYNKFISIIGCDLVRKLNKKNEEIIALIAY